MPRKSRGRPRDWHDKTAQNTIKSLDRAMEVFEFLSAAQGKTLTELATEPTPVPDEDAVPGGVGPATTALTPENFTNAFKKKTKPKDPGGQTVLAFGILAIVVALLAIGCAFIMSA